MVILHECKLPFASCLCALPISKIWTRLFNTAYPWLSRTEEVAWRYRARLTSSDDIASMDSSPDWDVLPTNKARFSRSREPQSCRKMASSGFTTNGTLLACKPWLLKISPCCAAVGWPLLWHHRRSVLLEADSTRMIDGFARLLRSWHHFTNHHKC